jgi:hypothetical protein
VAAAGAAGAQTVTTPRVGGATVTTPSVGSGSVTAPNAAPNTANVPAPNAAGSTGARARIEADGYRDVQGLNRSSDGTWRGQAMRGNSRVGVGVDVRGNVTAE